VSPNEASFDLRERSPLPRNILHTREMTAHEYTGQRANPKPCAIAEGYRGWVVIAPSPKVSADNLSYPADARDTAKSGKGRSGNRHLHHLAESISVNVGGSYRDVKASSLPMPDRSVGGAIVLGARESRVQGEGHQSVGIPAQNNRITTRRNLR
jgi:hypothetical protein